MAKKWDSKLPGCFAAGTAPFAFHVADEERAFQWLRSLRKRNIGWAKAKKQIREYLKSKGVTAQGITRQIAHAKPHLKPWISD